MQSVFDEIMDLYEWTPPKISGKRSGRINANQSGWDDDFYSYNCAICGLRHSFDEINPHNYQNDKKRQREDTDLPIKKYKKE